MFKRVAQLPLEEFEDSSSESEIDEDDPREVALPSPKEVPKESIDKSDLKQEPGGYFLLS